MKNRSYQTHYGPGHYYKNNLNDLVIRCVSSKKKKDFVEIVNKVLSVEKKEMNKRPNIDHLIKRILVERRKEERKNIFIFTLVLTVAAGIMTFAFYS